MNPVPRETLDPPSARHRAAEEPRPPSGVFPNPIAELKALINQTRKWVYDVQKDVKRLEHELHKRATAELDRTRELSERIGALGGDVARFSREMESMKATMATDSQKIARIFDAIENEREALEDRREAAREEKRMARERREEREAQEKREARERRAARANFIVTAIGAVGAAIAAILLAYKGLSSPTPAPMPAPQVIHVPALPAPATQQ